ncbi:hypothetical protein HHK36_020872 [Tetracentron sinense]|uniref:TRF2/HOY1 PH-like domain-containing protein n=1 Tax=Tetracentron sinense TaxID=13715 RepID=A0A834YZP7_TETSI|nr:hypothetical protein HHK36_020872 [Tetracentron sinense]
MLNGPKQKEKDLINDFCFEKIWNGSGGVSASDEFQNPSYGFDNGKNNGGCVFEGSEADSKRIMLMRDNRQGEAFLNLSKEPSALGLILKRTPSFLDIAEKLSQRSETTLVETNRSTDHEKARARNDFATKPITEKLKASNIPTSVLKIGSWERVSKYEGELVAKCYYAKRKLVWEMLEGASKSKIEVQWSDISAIRAVFPENEHGILEIELKQCSFVLPRDGSPTPKAHPLASYIGFHRLSSTHLLVQSKSNMDSLPSIDIFFILIILVMNFPPIEHQRASFTIPMRIGNHICELPLIASATQVSHGHPRRGSYLLLNYVEGSGIPPSDNHILNNIADHLVNDTLGECFDEQGLLSRVNSMSSFIGTSNEVSPIKTASTEYGHYNNTNTHFVPW